MASSRRVLATLMTPSEKYIKIRQNKREECKEMTEKGKEKERESEKEGGREGWKDKNIIHMAILLLKNNPGKNFLKGVFVHNC